MHRARTELGQARPCYCAHQQAGQGYATASTSKIWEWGWPGPGQAAAFNGKSQGRGKTMLGWHLQDLWLGKESIGGKRGSAAAVPTGDCKGWEWVWTGLHMVTTFLGICGGWVWNCARPNGTKLHHLCQLMLRWEGPFQTGLQHHPAHAWSQDRSKTSRVLLGLSW